MSEPMSAMQEVLASRDKSIESLKAELKDYKIRCQAWADRTLARDDYTHFLERHLESYALAMKELMEEIPGKGDSYQRGYRALKAYNAEYELRGQKPNDKESSPLIKPGAEIL